LTVNAPTITFSPTTLQTATVGTNYNQAITASGGTAPYGNFMVVSGGLPNGLMLASDGTISGNPTTGTGGVYTFTVQAQDSSGSDNGGHGPYTATSSTITLTVDEAPAVTSADNTTFSVGVMGSFTVTTRGYPKPSLSIPKNVLPSGVTFTDNGDGTATLSGAPDPGTASGNYPFTITAHNGIGADATQNFTLIVSPVSLQGGVLMVYGGPGDDTIVIALVPGNPATATVTINGVSPVPPQVNVSKVIAYGEGGNDTIRVTGRVAIPAELYGGDGNDTLQGGLGPNILDGGAGNDTLIGGAGRNVLVGGTGADTLHGGAADDLLIAGDWMPGSPLSDAQAALRFVQQQWLAATSYADRVNAVRDYVLARAVDDTSVDVLYGGGGSNLYFADLSGAVRDQLADRALTEIAIDLAGR
jgi:Ca2+-binding RTX toxin-like protein